MKKLYDLTFYSGLQDDYREGFAIGLFYTREEAETVKSRYLHEVNGFKDYYCEAEISEVSVIGGDESVAKVYRFTGWNANEDYDEIDIVYSDCYVSEEQAQLDLEKMKETTPRQEWALNCETIGKCQWTEGFTRIYPNDRSAPTLKECKTTLEEAINTQQMCQVECWYSDGYWYLFPIKGNDHLFLSAVEDDFLLDGFTIRRLRDIDKIEISQNKYQEIVKAEGLQKQIPIISVDITNWKTVFQSLKKLGKTVIVRKEHLKADDFVVSGCIVEVQGEKVYLRTFDEEGIWADESTEIVYEEITSVSFETRYLNIFEKYIVKDVNGK